MRLTAIRAKYFGIVTDADNIGSFSGPLSYVTNLPLSLSLFLSSTFTYRNAPFPCPIRIRFDNLIPGFLSPTRFIALYLYYF